MKTDFSIEKEKIFMQNLNYVNDVKKKNKDETA